MDVRSNPAGAGRYPARSKRPRTDEGRAASRCPARTAGPIRMNRKKAGTAVGRLSHETTAASARAMRGCPEARNNGRATLALHRESGSQLSNCPTGARRMRGSGDCYWSSSLFPRLLIDEMAAPQSFIHQVDRPPVRPISQAACHARFRRRLRGVSRPLRRSCRRERDFLFQECIAATGADLRRSLNTGKQSRETPDDRGIRRLAERGRKQVFHR